jgi:hypothetical protein
MNETINKLIKLPESDGNFDYVIAMDSGRLTDDEMLYIVKKAQIESDNVDRTLVGIFDSKSPIHFVYYKLSNIEDGFYIHDILNKDNIATMTKAIIVSLILANTDIGLNYDF